MKRLLIVLLILSLTSCSYIGATEDILVSSPPTQNTSALSSDQVIVQTETNVVEKDVVVSSLILNKSSKKIHFYDTCSYAARMNDENRSTAPYEQYTSLISSGYTVCSWCEKQIEKN